MNWFATEFPVKSISKRDAFIAQVIAWLQGTTYSTVFDGRSDSDLAGDNAYIRAQNGEELRLRELSANRIIEAIGFRHDFPDGEGRLWRTDAVLHRLNSDGAEGILRLRTECIARVPGARLESPRKPYLIKMILQDQWGGKDGELSVSDQPLWLTNDDAGLKHATSIALGKASRHLPVIYVSAIGASNWLLPADQINKLAFDLGGIAHVVVEPDRSFSFRLRDLTASTNVYGGTLGIALFGRGFVRRYYLGLRLTDVAELLATVQRVSTGIRTQMPAQGWDWTELQEQALRRLREQERNRLSRDEKEKLYEAEINNLADRIKQLEGQIAARPPEEEAQVEDSPLPDSLIKRVGPEIYPGEYWDRLRKAVAELPHSPALDELLQDLKRSTIDSKRGVSGLLRLLGRHGYREKADNKHIRMEAKDGYAGLDAITLPKTPSDARALLNLGKQIEQKLGITKLSE